MSFGIIGCKTCKDFKLGYIYGCGGSRVFNVCAVWYVSVGEVG